MKRRFFVATVALALVTTASPALAHQGNPNFRSELDGVVPPIDGLEVEVVNYDDSLELRNETGETVIVHGYEDEPYIRIEPDGQVSLNTRSPAYYLNDDRYGEVEVPPRADPKAEPEWEAVDGSGQYVWHDHRIHYMSTDTPAQVSDESQRTKIFDYRVPVEVGDRQAEVSGTLYWVGEEGGLPLAPFIALGALVLIGLAALWIRRRRNRGDAEAETEAW